MNSDPAYHARLMRELDEPARNALITQADNVIDARSYFEREMLNGVEVSMPFPFGLEEGE